MKNFIVKQILMSAVYLALVPIPALAQGTITLFQFGGPTTFVKIINNTDRSVLTDIGSKRSWAQPHGGETGHQYAYGTMQNAAIVVRVCSSTPSMAFVNPPPRWASDPSIVGNIILPNNYQNPSVSMLKERVNVIKKELKDRVGGKEMQRQLDDWFKTVKTEGFGFTGQGCQNPKILTAGADVSQWGYGRTILYVVEGMDGSYKMEQKVN